MPDAAGGGGRQRPIGLTGAPVTPFDAVAAFVVLLAAALLAALVSRATRLPISVALVGAGIVIQLVTPPLQVDPQLVIVAFLPGLVFEAAIRTRLEDLAPSLLGVALLAVPGVVVGALIVAAVLTLVGLPFELAFVVGAIVSATDPVAVVATFRRLGSPRQLASLVEAESLFNDGTAIVLYALALRGVAGVTEPAGAVATFAGVVVASTLLGVVAGLVAWAVIRAVRDHIVEILVTVVIAYGSFLVAETLHISGIVTTVVAGMTLAALLHRRGATLPLEAGIEPVWEFVGYVLTALAFLLIGVAMAAADLRDSAVAIAAGVVGVLVARAVVVYGLLAGAVRVAHPAGLSRGLPRAWLHVMFWAGLRGAVAVALALSLPPTVPQRDLLQDIVFGVVLFTLVVQATTAGRLIGRLGLRAAA